MKKRSFLVAPFFLLIICNLFAQDCRPKEPDCPFYYDTILQKKVYEVVELFPTFGGRETYLFNRLLMEEFGEMSKSLSPKDYQSRVVVCFVVNEQGTLKSIHICKKKEQEYSTLEKLMIKAVEKLKDEKWEPGKCKGTIVPVLMSIPISIDFRYN